ncbi:hypothetical protein [Halostagnicola sp. A-GB9-2]|nr:hypothetical protein [Halostagnicola sp. A-GB9-2]MDJ1434052.1 hypothetical protein [Halostagnicola sp. A-GB9-2]
MIRFHELGDESTPKLEETDRMVPATREAFAAVKSVSSHKGVR